MCLPTNFWKNSQPHGFAKECCSKTYSLSEELPYVCAYSYLYLCRMTNITCLHRPWRLCLPALFPEGVSTFYWLITILRIQSSLGQKCSFFPHHRYCFSFLLHGFKSQFLKNPATNKIPINTLELVSQAFKSVHVKSSWMGFLSRNSSGDEVMYILV